MGTSRLHTLSRSSTRATTSAPTRSLGPKDAHDKFYTKPEVALACIERLDLDRFTRIIEPSAGAGSFSSQLLAQRDRNVIALDLVPEHPSVRKQDWFNYTELDEKGPTLVIGNPPFGRQGSLANRFMDHAFDQVGAQTVAFILPRGFQKESVQERVFRFARLSDQLILPENSFTLNGKDYSLPAVFQVWERSASAREYVPGPLTSRFVNFVRPVLSFDFIVRRVGGSAGRAYEPNRATTSSVQTNYFLTLNRTNPEFPKGVRVRDVVKLINGLGFAETIRGTGPNSLSKREFVAYFDSAFEQRFARG